MPALVPSQGSPPLVDASRDPAQTPKQVVDGYGMGLSKRPLELV
ncbi:MAG: hypothetical protein ABW137_34435 [Mycobacterium sp.]